MGLAHLAFAVGDAGAVDRLTAEIAAAGFPVIGPPRRTGHGHHESVDPDPDGNRVEVAAVR